MTSTRWIRALRICLGLALAAGATSCTTEELSPSPQQENVAETQLPVSYPSQSCVSDFVHWNFYSDCATDVSMSAGSVVVAESSGTVQVYPSCLGYAGQGVRVSGAEGKYLYSHVNASVSNGSWVNEGDVIGTIYGPGSSVYCNSSLSVCGYGYSPSEGRTTACWTAPHLHFEGPCCPGCKDPAADSAQCTFNAGCQADGSPCDYCYSGSCSSSYIGTNDGCDCGCGVHDPDCAGGGSGCTYECADYGYSPGQCHAGWQCDWPCLNYTNCSSGPVCGDNSCDSGETCSSCPADCGSCCTYECDDYGYSPGQCHAGWQCNWPCLEYTNCSSCQYQCADYYYSPGQCYAGWKCDWPCLSYTGCSG